MRFKTDENLPTEIAELLVQAGHNALRIDEQKLSGTLDPGVAAVCLVEDRALVTLDLDFSDIRAYPAERYPGIIVLHPSVQSIPVLIRMTARFIPLLATEPLIGHLWIVDDNRIRIRPSIAATP